MHVVPLYRLDAQHPQAAACARCAVRGDALFGALDDAGLDRIHTHIASLDHPPDSLVYRRGSTASAMFTIRSGLVRFERFNERGERRIVRLAGRGDLIGQEALLQRAHNDDAVACTAVQLCRIPTALVAELGQGQAPLQRELMLRWQQALEASEAWIAELAFGAARQRMLRLLHRLNSHADAQGHIWLPRRDEIGAMLDMSFETASRQISQLRRDGVLTLATDRRATLNTQALDAALRSDGRV